MYVMLSGVEAWQARADRLHDRFLFSGPKNKSWKMERLAPKPFSSPSTSSGQAIQDGFAICLLSVVALQFAQSEIPDMSLLAWSNIIQMVRVFY